MPVSKDSSDELRQLTGASDVIWKWLARFILSVAATLSAGAVYKSCEIDRKVTIHEMEIGYIKENQTRFTVDFKTQLDRLENKLDEVRMNRGK